MFDQLFRSSDHYSDLKVMAASINQYRFNNKFEQTRIMKISYILRKEVLHLSIFLTTRKCCAVLRCRNSKNTMSSITDDFDVLKFWGKNVDRFPLLSHFARKVLETPASSGQSERLYSDCGLTVSERRASETFPFNSLRH